MTRFFKNNKGSGLITVLVAFIFMFGIASLLMFLTYTYYTVSLAQKTSLGNEYTVETASDEIKAGLQVAVSEAINKSYSKTVIENKVDENFTGIFQSNFRNALFDWKDSNNSALFSKTGASSYKYSVNILQSMVETSGINGTLAVSSTDNSVLIEDDALYLENVKITYTVDGFTSTALTDYKIEYPEITIKNSRYAVSGIPNYAVIADGSISQATTSLNSTTLTGNVFAGSLSLSGARQLVVEKGMLVCKGEVSVENKYNTSEPRLIVDSYSELWADTIKLDNSADISLLGDTYVANDLKFLGANCSAKLSGSYIGFGNEVDNPDTPDNPDKCSSILSNAFGCSLDISGLENFSLGGVSFVSSSSGTAPLGESVSVKGNQIAYLISAKDVTYTTGKTVASNPDVLTEEKDVNPLDTTKTLWISNNKACTYATYGITMKVIKYNIPGGGVIQYYFMSFDTPEHRNQYFKDYFKNNTADITEYMNQYLTVSGTYAGSIYTEGNWYITDGDEIYFKSADTSSSPDFGSYSSSFSNLCTFLSESGSSDGAEAQDTLFEYLIDTGSTSKYSALPGGNNYFTLTQGSVTETLGVITKGDYTYPDPANSKSSEVCFIIAEGNVTLNKNFSGIVICGGNLVIGKDVTKIESNSANALYALSAVYNGEKLSDYLGVTILDDSESGTEGRVWNLQSLVSASDWKQY